MPASASHQIAEPQRPAVEIMAMIRRAVDFLNLSPLNEMSPKDQNASMLVVRAQDTQVEIESIQKLLIPHLDSSTLDKDTNVGCFVTLQSLKTLVTSAGHRDLLAFAGNRPFERLEGENFSDSRVQRERGWLARVDSAVVLGRDLQQMIERLDRNEFVKRENK